MALPTANLPVSLICSTLGVNSPKEIFYNGSTLKTIVEIGQLVSKAGLDPNYCPGADADARLTNLLADRRLSYFKGYDHIQRIDVYNRGVHDGNFVVNYAYNSGYMTFSEESDYLKIVKTSGGTERLEIRLDVEFPHVDRNYVTDNGLKWHAIISVVSGSGTLADFLITTWNSTMTGWASLNALDLSGAISVIPETTYTAAGSPAWSTYPGFNLSDYISADAFEIRIHEIYFA